MRNFFLEHDSPRLRRHTLLLAGAFVTTPTSYYARLTGQENWTDTITFSSGQGVKTDTIDHSGAATTETLKAATAAAKTITDGTTAMLVIDTRNTATAQGNIKALGQPLTITAAGTAMRAETLTLAAKTITLTGGTTTTSMLGIGMYVEAQTVTDSTSCTLSAASMVHIAQLAAAGGSLTITASYMVSTGVSDCFLTNAGVWTDHACFKDGKHKIAAAEPDAVLGLLDRLLPRQWEYNEMHGDDMGRQRLGIVFDELPDELRAPGHKVAVAGSLLASFALAALKCLLEESRSLKARLSALEAQA